MVVTWIGHASVLIQTHGLNILTDPIYAERAGPFGFGPQRVAAPGVRFDDLPKIDLVLVSHNGGYITAYGNNETLLVQKGDAVKKGQQIAKVGSGASGEPRLHFEVRHANKTIDPMTVLPGQ